MRKRTIAKLRSSPRAIAALLTVIVIVAASALPAMGATVEEFTDGSGERGMFLRGGQPDNSSRVPFPSDTRVRDAGVTLKSNQTLEYVQTPADGGNMSAWWSQPSFVDLSVLDVDAFKDNIMTADELNRLALNSTSSSKATVSPNATTHMFAFNLTAATGGGDRDLSIVLDWTGMGTQQGSLSANSLRLHVADFALGKWHTWDEFSRFPSAPDQEHFHLTVGPHAGWADDTGMVYILVTVEPAPGGSGTTLVTSFVLMETWRSRAPADLTVDVGGDGTFEFAWTGEGVGLYGLQNALADGTITASADLLASGEHVNFTSFLVPAGAELVKASLALAGQPGDQVISTDPRPEFVEADGFTVDTKVTAIPDYAHPSHAQVVLTNLKNAGMKDQSQETLRNSQTIGDYGGANSSVSQSFIPSISGKLVFVNLSLVGYVYNNPPNVLVEIRDVDVNGHPNTTVIGSSIIDGNRLNESTTKWHIVSFNNVYLNQGTQYAIVCSVPQAKFLEYYEWKNHLIISGDPYDGGKAFVDDTHDGSGPWLENQNTDQAFMTYMETDIGAGVGLVKVAGRTYSEVRAGASGDEYVFNISRVSKNGTGVWVFPITNGNPFPVTFNWSAELHVDVYPQDFGLLLSTAAASAPFWAYLDTGIALEGYRWLDFTENMTAMLDGAEVAYTAPNGVEFVRVNVSVRGAVAGMAWMSGLRVRYHMPVDITGPGVVAAAEAYRASHSSVPTVELPFVVTSSVPARVFLSDPLLDYDQRPTFTTETQVIDEDTFAVVDLDTLFGDDYDNNALAYEVVGNTEPGDMGAVLNGSMLNLTPAQDWSGEADVTVRGTDTSGLYRDGVVKVVVQALNDPPYIDIEAPSYTARARETKVLDLSASIGDVDGDEVTLSTNSSSITVEDMTLYCIFDTQGTYLVLLTATDGVLTTNETLTFTVSPAVGFPEIVGLPSEWKVPVNRPLPINLEQFGRDDDDDPGDLSWSVEEDSPLFDAVLAADGFNLTITPTGTNLGTGPLWLTLTNTKDNSVTERVRVNVTAREKVPPRINHDTLPSKIKLTKGGDGQVIELADHVEDEITPIDQLVVEVSYGKEGVVYVDVQAGVLTFVPQDTGRTKVTIKLTNLDGMDASFEVDVEVEDKDADGDVNWTFWVLILIIVVIIMMLVLWPRKAAGAAAGPVVVPKVQPADLEVPHKRVEKVKAHTFSTSALRTLEDVFLFHTDGMLLSQYTRRLKDGVDKDIETAIISGIKEQLTGRMRTREEPNDFVELEGMQVVIERGADLALAAVLSGEVPDGLRVQMRRTLNEVQTRNQRVLDDWDGDLSRLHEVENSIIMLVEALIRDHNGSQDLSVDGENMGDTGRPAPVVVDGVPELEDEDEPLHLVKDIIGEEKTRELKEGHHRTGEEGKE